MKRQLTQTQTRLDSAWPYAATPGFYDEVLGANEEVRPHWRKLAESLATMGHADLARRWHDGRRLIHDNGITYNIYSDPQNNARPWQLDPIPLVMDPEEWKAIEAGIVQRAILFNTMLADLYGPQRLLREDQLPRELVFPNPAFLRSCWGIVPQGGVYLHIIRPTSRAPRTGSGGSSRTARKRRREPVTRSKIGWSPPASCRTSSAPRTCAASPISFRPTATRCSEWSPSGGRIHASWCSPPVHTTKHILNTRFWRAIWVTPWWKAAISLSVRTTCS